MAKLKSILFLIPFLISSLSAKSQVLSSNDANSFLTIKYSIENYSIDTVFENGKKYSKFNVKGIDAYLLEKGNPQLPLKAIDISLEGNSIQKIKVESINYSYIDGLPPLPSKGNFTRNLNPSLVKLYESDIYKKNQWFPKDNIKAGKPFVLRGVDGAAITICPVQYNGEMKKFRIIEEIVFSIVKSDNFQRSKSVNNKSKEFKNILGNRFINYKTTSTRYSPVNDGERMIIISPQKYVESMQPFVNWKNQKGIKTTVHIYPDETGADTNQIKNFIKSKYQSEQISYVTLVGDAEDIPSYMVEVDDKNYGAYFDSIVPADPLYAMVDGDDLYPDLFIGRISVESSSQVTDIINKIIKYEKNPDPSGSWYHKAVGVGSNEGSPADADWIEDSIHTSLSDYGYSTLYTIFEGDGKSESSLSQYINDGLGLVNFMGHGNFDGFGFSSGFWYSYNYARDLTNGDMLPVVIPLACNFGQFLGRDGAAEYWLRNPNGGAVAITGSTPLMDWTPPQWAQVEMNRLITQEAYNSFGAYFYNGEMQMLDVSVYQGEKTAKTWVYFGDPALQLFTKTPSAMNFTYSQDRSGSISVTGENDAFVTLVNSSNEIIESKNVVAGRVDFSFTANAGDTVTLTATKRNRVPYIKTIIVGESTAITKNYNSTSFKIKNLTPRSLQIVNSDNGTYRIKILSLNGRVVIDRKYDLKKGLNSLNISDIKIPKGIILIKVNGTNKNIIRKMVMK